MRNSDLYLDRGSTDMFGTLIDSVSERVAERICSRIEEKLHHRQRIQQTSQSSLLSSPDSLCFLQNIQLRELYRAIEQFVDI